MKTHLTRFLFATSWVAAVSSVMAAAPSLESKEFGRLPDGSAATLYTLRNSHGSVVKLTNYGATITALQVPDRAGHATNVILGSDNLAAYLKGFPAASTIGRFANRIRNGRFTLEGDEVRVTANAGKHHIHGGKKGFSSVLWESSELPPGDDRRAVKMSYRSGHGEEGFPGNCVATVTFTLTEADELIIDYGATTDRTTVINLTNHAYFNLAGSGDVLDHQLELRAARYTESDSDLIPTGVIAPVAGTPLDFTTPRRIGERLPVALGGRPGYDHNFVLDSPAGDLRLAARVSDPKSGRVMECWTTEPGLQLYTANHFPAQPGPEGASYLRYAAFCLETQHYPDSPNQPEFPSTILRPDKPFSSTTKFKFSR